jgi:16S rRNA (cytosine967-C5)-methyltransferase
MPKLYDPTMQTEITALAEYQKQFLKVAAKMVKPGGRIVYSVCTLTLEECEEVVRFAVEDCSLKVEEPSIRLGSSGLWWVITEAVFTQRFHPHIHGCGFFIASLRKP